MMNPADMHTALMVNTVESVDKNGLLIPLRARREADELLEGDRVGTPSESLTARARALGNYLALTAPMLLKVSDQLNAVSAAIIWFSAVVSLVFGFGAHSMGEGELFHLLSPLLLSLIAWNFLSIALILTAAYRLRRVESSQRTHTRELGISKIKSKVKIPSRGPLPWVLKLIQRLVTWSKLRASDLRSTEDEALEIQRDVLKTYLSRRWELSQGQVFSEVRRALHLMAIAFVSGVLLSAYWDGLIHEYKATVESTFLSLDTMESLLSLILAPATALGLGEIDLSSLRPTGPEGALLGEAAIWIHRYAVSLFVWVVAPRLFFAFMETLNVWRESRQASYKLKWFEQVPTLNIGLASHTNIGKTSLARTLLRRDVGVVKDGEHVTRSRSCYFLINRPSVRVRLWDTPGFGALLEHPMSAPSTSLESRLETEAFEALRDEADLILYLVPAWPKENELRRSIKELRLLTKLGHPIILIINRLNDPKREAVSNHPRRDDSSRKDRALALWSEALGEELQRETVHSILILDAFEKPLSDERRLYTAIHSAVTDELKPLTNAALVEWERERVDLIEQLSLCIERCLDQLIRLEEVIEGRGKRKKEEAVSSLNQRSEAILSQALERVLDLLGLEGELRKEVFESTMSVTFLQADRSEKRKWGAIWGGAISGLTTGVMADVMSGGLSLGGGMIVGAIFGAIGGAGLVEGYEYINDENKRVTLSVESLMSLCEKLTLFTLDASAHGRARGEYIGHTIDQNIDEISGLQKRCALATAQLFNERGDAIRESIEQSRGTKRRLKLSASHDERDDDSQTSPQEPLSPLTAILMEGMELN